MNDALRQAIAEQLEDLQRQGDRCKFELIRLEQQAAEIKAEVSRVDGARQAFAYVIGMLNSPLDEADVANAIGAELEQQAHERAEEIKGAIQ